MQNNGRTQTVTIPLLSAMERTVKRGIRRQEFYCPYEEIPTDPFTAQEDLLQRKRIDL
jgi:hypothetical protein